MGWAPTATVRRVGVRWPGQTADGSAPAASDGQRVELRQIILFSRDAVIAYHDKARLLKSRPPLTLKDSGLSFINSAVASERCVNAPREGQSAEGTTPANAEGKRAELQRFVSR